MNRRGSITPHIGRMTTGFCSLNFLHLRRMYFHFKLCVIMTCMMSDVDSIKSSSVINLNLTSTILWNQFKIPNFQKLLINSYINKHGKNIPIYNAQLYYLTTFTLLNVLLNVDDELVRYFVNDLLLQHFSKYLIFRSGILLHIKNPICWTTW